MTFWRSKVSVTVGLCLFLFLKVWYESVSSKIKLSQFLGGSQVTHNSCKPFLQFLIIQSLSTFNKKDQIKG